MLNVKKKVGDSFETSSEINMDQMLVCRQNSHDKVYHYLELYHIKQQRGLEYNHDDVKFDPRLPFLLL